MTGPIGAVVERVTANKANVIVRWDGQRSPDDLIVAELGRLFGGSEQVDHGAVIDPLVAEIGAPDDRRTGPQRGASLWRQRTH